MSTLSVTKNMLFVFACLLASAGFAILAYDGMFFLTNGCDVNAVAGADHGVIYDWPTGDMPRWALVPAYVYAVALLLLAWAISGIRHWICAAYSRCHWPGTE
jgi:hypothetical protein